MSSTREYINSDRHDFYNDGFLDLEKCPDDPFHLFESWLETAIEEQVQEPYAFNLATVDNAGAPHARILYMRDMREGNLMFYTNYTSDKGEQMDQNPKACMTFFWAELSRQVRVEGRIEKLEADLSDAYFASRPRGSQIGAWASQQSKELMSRQDLEDKIKELEARFEGKAVPRPEHWGGYKLIPSYYEFWLGHPSRLHDRLIYEQQNFSWNKMRLNP